MIFKIIFDVILFIGLITLMYNVIVGVRTKDDKLIVLCGIGSGLIGMIFGVILGSILF
jgi:hypothetical protein